MLVVNGEKLMSAIVDAGMSISEVARRAKIQPRMISEMIHKPIRFVRLKTLSKIRRVLGLCLHELIKCDVKRSEAKFGTVKHTNS